MLTLALTFNMLHFMYHQLTLHFDFYPFNNIHAISFKRRMTKSLLVGVMVLFPLIALRLENHLLIEISLVVLVIILIHEFITWWTPYLTSASEEWQARYLEVFQETLKVLPPIRDNPIPNLEHCILHLLTLLSFISTIFYYTILLLHK